MTINKNVIDLLTWFHIITGVSGPHSGHPANRTTGETPVGLTGKMPVLR
ncbi:MAG: hypothetical protein FWE88_00505 [Phycisphaerae bacterium]|nr:hypothetical protein [Phycisphaerae bacterium]